MQHSDIFAEYNRISEEKGLIKKAESMSEEEKYSDKEWRENIEALYGVKIKVNDSDKDVIEQAHPNKVIVAPAYDKVNGLMENIWERHDIMIGITNKPMKGTESRFIYAEDLLRDLIKIGFEAENNGEEDIRKLADSCSERVVKGIEKKAQFWGIITKFAPKVLMGLAAIVGFSKLKDRTMGLVANGIKPDTDRALESLHKFAEVANPDGKQLATQWITAITYYKTLSDKALSILSRTHDIPGDVKTEEGMIWAIDHAPKIEANKEELAYVDKYMRVSRGLISRIPAAAERFKNMAVNKENSTWGELANDIKSLFEVGSGNEGTDAGLALEALSKSIESTVRAYIETVPEAKQAVSDTNDALKGLQESIEKMNPFSSGSDDKAKERIHSILGQ